MSLGENVKRLRDKNGWSQKDLARLACVSQPTIANIETGTSTTSKHLFKLAKVFGVPVTELEPDIGAVPPLQQKPLFLESDRQSCSRCSRELAGFCPASSNS